MANRSELGRKGNHPDLLAGMIFIVVGALGLWAGRDLRMGTAAMMGPGYLPLIVSGLILLIGLAVTIMGLLRSREPLGVVRLRPLLIILVAVGGFAYAAGSLGFVIAAAWLIGIGSLADPESRLREIAASIVVLTIFGILVFIVGLGVQMQLGPF
ncbi:tripartite tricarboxylate transporter TctB family protein [Microvirga zambiensis]|uniref:tripartite tricarboxylate transporter TctB family protein n=1 Tax=Microvirga zambiensis TaxID=1402137 RepID=UPI00191FC051|nr:tripartite tricarboxylate transporter TctB family protein [Microvirga zambiensis]